MKKNKYILFALPVIIILIVVIFIITSPKKVEVLYCDPVASRGNSLAKWQETITPKQVMTKVDNNFFDKIKVTTDANEITVQYPFSGSPEEPFPFEIREMKFNQPLEIGGGTLSFYDLGVAYCDANHISGENVPYEYFDAQLQPEKTEVIDKIWTYNNYEQDSRFQYYPWPYVNFAFEYKGIEDVMFNGIKVFDARTHKLMSTGYSSSGTHTDEWTGHTFKINIPIWHYTPVDLVLDVSFGPSKTFEFPPEAGEGFKQEGFECRLISILDNIDTSHSSNSSYSNKSVIRIYKASANGRRGSNFIFACHPTASQIPVTFDFLDKDGQNISGGGGSTSGYIQENRLDQPLEKVALIQAKYRTNRYRIILHLPYIPGLPEQNKNIDNLFDVYIPYMKFNSSDRLDAFLYETLQLRRLKTTGQKPYSNSSQIQFPAVFTDITVRDIAKQYTTGATLNADLEHEVLEIKYPVPFLTKLKMLFYKIRQNNNE